MRDLMIDIETLGNRPGSVILSIGAVTFDAETGDVGDEFYVAIDPTSCTAVGLTPDISTAIWWMKQSDDARQAAISGTEIITSALAQFSEFIRRNDAIRVWAKPPSFDLVLLEAAFVACTMDIPWPYWTHRDCRTLFDLTATELTATGTKHNALHDAKSQAIGVIEAYSKMRSAPQSGIERAARFVEKRRDEYVQDHGSYDLDTGATEFPGDGLEYVAELEEIIDGIRGLTSQEVAKP